MATTAGAAVMVLVMVLATVAQFSLLAAADPRTPIPGVHTPLPIDPKVIMPDNAWLLYLYRCILGEADAVGFTVNFEDLQHGTTRDTIYGSFIASAEFKADPRLGDRTNFIARAYRSLLNRDPTSSEISSLLAILRNADGSGSGSLTWMQLMQRMWMSVEYKNVACVSEYYTLGSPVNIDAILMQDLFSGAARMQLSNESQRISLTVPSALRLWDNKLPMLIDPRTTLPHLTWWSEHDASEGVNNKTSSHSSSSDSSSSHSASSSSHSHPHFRPLSFKIPVNGGYIAFTRALLSNTPAMFTIVLLTSADGVTFTEVGPIFSPKLGQQTFYDAHVAPDYSVCPTRYVMAMECVGHAGVASLCISESTTPWLPETWTDPVIVVDGCSGNMQDVCHTKAVESASTGVTMTDGTSRYVAWTQVYDGVGPNDPLAHTYSQSAGPVSDYSASFGTVIAGSAGIHVMMNSDPHPFCTDAWDCNNRDKQDWKREGDYYYALYNGANYYRCNGSWGISVSRARSPLDEYTDRLPLSHGIPAVRSDTCGISYPMLNVLDGNLYVYYAFVDASGTNYPMRARFVSV